MIKVISKNNLIINYEKQVENGTPLRDMVPWGEEPIVKVGDLAYAPHEWDYIPADDSTVELVDVLGSDPITIGVTVAVITGAIVGTAIGVHATNQLKKYQKRLQNSADAVVDRADPSPTYNGRANRVQSGGNASPSLIYGNINGYFPSLGAYPYFSFDDDNNEFVHYLYWIGEGEHQITTSKPLYKDGTALTVDKQQFRIGETNSTDLNYYKASDHTGDYESEYLEGSDINDTNVAPATRPYDVNILPVLDFTSVELESEGDQPSATDAFETYTRQNPATNWRGPYTVNPAGDSIDSFYIDYHAPNGVYWLKNNVPDRWLMVFYVQYRAIDENGVAGSWVDKPPANVPNAETTNVQQNEGNAMVTFPGNNGVAGFAMRGRSDDPTATRSQSVRYDLNAIDKGSKIQVRVRLGRKANTNFAPGRARWYGIRGVLTTRPRYRNGSWFMLALRALEENRETRGKINFDITRKLKDFNASGQLAGDATATRSAARAVYDLLKSERYGLGLLDAKIDLKELQRLRLLWEAENYHSDVVFDRNITAREALDHLLLPARSTRITQLGRIGFAYDVAKTDPVAFFGPHNIISGSFEIRPFMPRDIVNDGTEVSYYNNETRKNATYKYTVNQGTIRQPEKIRLLAITDSGRAEEHCQYLDRQRFYLREVIKFDTWRDGLVVQYGDLIAVTHDLIEFPNQYTIIGMHQPVVPPGDPIPDPYLILDRPVPSNISTPIGIFNDSSNEPTDSFSINVDAVNRRHIRVPGRVLKLSQADPTLALLDQVNPPDSIGIRLGGDKKRSWVAIGETTPAKHYTVKQKSITGTNRVSIEAIEYDSRVY